jgi:AraC-like DNA-binding protein
MHTTERHARNDLIVQLRACRFTLKQIAEEVGLSERHCARILKERTDRSTRDGAIDRKGVSNATTTELLDELQRAVGDLAALARVAPARNLGAALRLEIVHQQAAYAIDELRHRSAEILAPNGKAPIAGDNDALPLSEADMS